MKSEGGAVRALRLALGETQEAFSRRMAVTVRTASRWETGKNPAGHALLQMKRLAVECGREDLRAVFDAAIADAGLAWDTSDLTLDLEARTDDERLEVAGWLAALRNPQYEKLRTKVSALLREPKRHCIDILEKHRLAKRTETDAMRLLDAGVEAAAVAKALKVPEADVQRLALLLRMRRSLERVKEQK